MTLTEKVKTDMGGLMYKAFVVKTLSGDTTGTISLGAVGMNEVIHANFTWTSRTMTADSTTWPTFKTPTTSGGVDMALSGLITSAAAGDSGILECWGY